MKMFNLYPVQSNNASTGSSSPRRSRVRRAIIVDHDPDHCSMLLRHLVGSGFVVVIAQGWFEALSIIGRDAPDVALFQRDGDDGDCARAVALARMLYPDTQVIQMDEVVDPGQVEAAAFLLARPVSLPRLDDALRALAALRAAG